MSYCQESPDGSHAPVEAVVDDFDPETRLVRLVCICDYCGGEGIFVFNADDVEWEDEDEEDDY